MSSGTPRGSNPGGDAGGGGLVDWKLYLVQEFCDAGPLASALDARQLHDASGLPSLVRGARRACGAGGGGFGWYG